MELYLDTKLAGQYKSPLQRIRILTEAWVDSQIFCPSCGHDINRYENNKPVADFYCQSYREEYELKSKKDSIGTKVLDGAYRTMLQRLESEPSEKAKKSTAYFNIPLKIKAKPSQ